MSKLRFDPVTYQFYYRCRAEESEEARAAGSAGIRSAAGITRRTRM
jgi:hypothetical protein